MKKAVGDSVSNAVRSRISRNTPRAWSAADFPDFPAPAVTSALQRLARSGDLVAIRHGLYWRGQRYSWGMARPDALELAYAISHSKGIGWAGLSAANILGLTTQVPGADTVAVPAPKPRDVPGLRIVSRTARMARAKSKLTAIEVAVLEVLTDWESVIDVTPNDAIRHLVDLFVGGGVNADRVARGATDEAGPARDRLRVVLTGAGREDLTEQVRPSMTPSTTVHALAGITA